nr:cobalamin-dependent protein [Actinocrispum wychmicini]
MSVVVTSVASDSHTWNLVYLQLVLTELGHCVRNLGPCVPGRLLLDECRRDRPDLIVVSTVNGHGLLDGTRLIADIRRCPELAATPVVIGGKLGVRGSDRQRREWLLAAGFTEVFEETGAAAVLPFLARLTESVLR